MKTKVLIWCALWFAGSSIAADAVIPITVPDAYVSRTRAAFGRRLSLGRPATAAEIKAVIQQFVKDVVRQDEEREAHRAITPPAEIDVQ